MLYFAIPLKPRRFAADWERTGRLFRSTLRSVLRQTDPRFRVVVAYTDPPDDPCDDPRVEFIYSPCFETDPRRGVRDKRDKILAIGRHVRRRGGGRLMFVDADDLVSRRLAAFLNRSPHADGFVARFGLEYDDRTGRLRFAPRFWSICGSSIALRLQANELPNGAPGEERRHFLSRSHHLWAGARRAAGRRIRCFPFAPAIYRIHTGENLSLLARGHHGWKRAWLRRCSPSFPPPRLLRREFALEDDAH